MHRQQPSGLMPKPDAQVGMIFRLAFVTLALLLGLLGCGWMASYRKQEVNRIVGYDIENRKLEEKINTIFVNNDRPPPYPQWVNTPTSWIQKTFY